MMSTAAQMLIAAPVLALMTVIHGDGWIRPGIDAMAVGALVYLAVFGSIIGFGAYVYLLDKVRPAIATSYAYVNPPIAVLFGVMLGGEFLHRLDLIAMAIILAGVVLGTLALKTRSIWSGFLIHVTVAVSMDLAALLQTRGLPGNIHLPPSWGW